MSKFTPTERGAKGWIAKRLGLSFSGLTDSAMCALIAEKTGWSLPLKRGRKPFMARYWREVLHGEPPAPTFKRRRRFVPRKGDFYQSEEWRALRYRALKLHGASCQCCGRSARHGIVIHVDHIKPPSKYPELELVLSNLQVLCEDCNLGKMARDETDWRPTEDGLEILPDGATEHMRSLQ